MWHLFVQEVVCQRDNCLHLYAIYWPFFLHGHMPWLQLLYPSKVFEPKQSSTSIQDKLQLKPGPSICCVLTRPYLSIEKRQSRPWLQGCCTSESFLLHHSRECPIMKNGKWLREVLVPNITLDYLLSEWRTFSCLRRKLVENTSLCPPSLNKWTYAYSSLHITVSTTAFARGVITGLKTKNHFMFIPVCCHSTIFGWINFHFYLSRLYFSQ